VNQGRAFNVLPHDDQLEQEVGKERRETQETTGLSLAVQDSGQTEGNKSGGTLIEKEDVIEGRVFWKICKLCLFSHSFEVLNHFVVRPYTGNMAASWNVLFWAAVLFGICVSESMISARSWYVNILTTEEVVADYERRVCPYRDRDYIALNSLEYLVPRALGHPIHEQTRVRSQRSIVSQHVSSCYVY
jgi:hypothetical protein